MYRYAKFICLIGLLVYSSQIPVHAQDEPLHFVSITMLDKNTGWSMAGQQVDDQSQNFSIMRTADGGKTWRVVFSKPESAAWYPDIYAQAYFLDNSYAWLTLYQEHSIRTTRDGGNTWQEVPIASPASGISYGIFSFVDHDHGWFLALGCCAAGNESATLYQTTDGGASWNAINDSRRNPGLGTAYHTGIDFVDAKTGWMTESSIGSKQGVQETTDGGASWQALTLTIPEGETNLNNCGASLPRAFSTLELTFVVRCESQPQANYFYLTKDGGKTQTITHLPPSSSLYPYVYMFDHSTGWFVGSDNSPNTALYQTRDGGLTWSELTVMTDAADFSNNHVFTFGDQNTGWSISQDGTILSTVDGGKTWQVLDAKLAQQ